MKAANTPSPVLLEANRRLQEKRTRLQAMRTDAGKQASPRAGTLAVPAAGGRQVQAAGPSENVAPDPIRQLANLPDHLGWGSSNLATALRRTQARRRRVVSQEDAYSLDWLRKPTGDSDTPDCPPPSITCRRFSIPSTVKHYPDIGLGMLQNDQAPAGRIWLLLRFLDEDGRGWIRIDMVKRKLTQKYSNVRVCGWRQLRNLLATGEGIFWERDNRRIWLRSAGRVAAALGVERLSGKPIELPLDALLGTIGEVRAHLYAAFHSGRRHDNPISRQTLEEITGIPPRTQRAYEQIAGVESTTNIAVGEKYDKAAAQERAWRHGRATFVFIDHQGLQGPEGRQYVAWRLPNSYQGCHRQTSKGRQKKVNRKLKDLVNKRARGNSSESIDRLFHPDGATAAKAYNRNAYHDAFWPHGRAPLQPNVLWYVLSERKET